MPEEAPPISEREISSPLGPQAKMWLAWIAIGLSALDTTNMLPGKYDNLLEGIVFIILALGGMSTARR